MISRKKWKNLFLGKNNYQRGVKAIGGYRLSRHTQDSLQQRASQEEEHNYLEHNP
jgi:hypothetical protein